MHVAYADFFKERRAGEGIGVQKAVRNIRGDADAIVGYVNAYILFTLLVNMYGDCPRVPFWLNAMENAVFHNGLQSELYNLALGQAFFHFNILGDCAAVTVLLDGEVIFNQRQFMFQRDQGSGAFGNVF